VTESWVQLHAHPTTDGGLSVYGHDITERQEAERRVEVAREAERGRIARTLHDDALQGLSDAIALVAMADRTTAESGLAGRLLPVLRRVGEQLRSAIYDLRSRSEEQRPFVELLAGSWTSAGRWRAMARSKWRSGMGCPAVLLGVECIEVLGILGEALTNARRHGQARHVRVRVWGTKAGLRAGVSDDNRGLIPGAPRRPSTAASPGCESAPRC
jgi:signal transduction histidine kinase